MAVGGLPVCAQAREALGEDAAGEVRAVDPGEDEEAAVVSHQGQATAALGFAPADPLLAISEVVGGGTPT